MKTKYYYLVNGDGTTHGGFTPFLTDDGRPRKVAIAPDWKPSPRIECGKALHVIKNNPLNALWVVERRNGVAYEVKPICPMPERWGKMRCKGVRKIRRVSITLQMVQTTSVALWRLSYLDLKYITTAALKYSLDKWGVARKVLGQQMRAELKRRKK